MTLLRCFVVLCAAIAALVAPARAISGATDLDGVHPKPVTAQFLAAPGSAEEPVPADAGAQATCPSGRSSEADQPDGLSGPQTQLIYLVPAGEADQCLDEGTVQASMGSLNAFFVAQGLGALRLDRTPAGALDIPFVRGQKEQSAYQDVAAIKSELRARGFTSSQKRYIVFAASRTGPKCGQAEYPGSWAAFFLDSNAACGVRDFGDGTLAGAGAAEVVTAHEILHNEGVVSLLAPNGCQVSALHYGHVCTPPGLLVEVGRLDPEYVDIMFPYAIEGVRLGEKVIDRNHDDYFRLGSPQTMWLTDLAASPYFD